MSWRRWLRFGWSQNTISSKHVRYEGWKVKLAKTCKGATGHQAPNSFLVLWTWQKDTHLPIVNQEHKGTPWLLWCKSVSPVSMCWCGAGWRRYLQPPYPVSYQSPLVTAPVLPSLYCPVIHTKLYWQYKVIKLYWRQCQYKVILETVAMFVTLFFSPVYTLG